MTLTEQLKIANEKIGTLSADLEAAQKRDIELSQDLANATQTIEKLNAQVAELTDVTAKQGAEKADLLSQIEQLQAAVKSAEESAGKKAQDALAKIGVLAVDDKPTAAEKTSEELMAEYNRLAQDDFAAARAFWKKHETKLQDPKILAALKRQ